MQTDSFLPEILPCSACGVKPERLETARPEGRMCDLYRVDCGCGHIPPKWSVSVPAAIRLWNSFMAGGEKRK